LPLLLRDVKKLVLVLATLIGRRGRSEFSTESEGCVVPTYFGLPVDSLLTPAELEDLGECDRGS
jgi:hypothetical protein